MNVLMMGAAKMNKKTIGGKIMKNLFSPEI